MPPKDLFEEYGVDLLEEEGVDLLADDVIPQPSLEVPSIRGLGAAWEEVTTPIYGEGGMTETLPRMGEKILRTAGHLGEAAGDVMMGAAKTAYKYAVPPAYQTALESSFANIAETDFAKSQMKTLRGAKEAAGMFAKEYPRAAEDIEAGINAINLYPAYQIGKAMVPIAKAAGAGIIKAPGAIKNVFYPEPTFDEALGQVLQGKTRDLPKGKKALSAIDTSDVKTYAELGKKIDNAIPEYARQVDAELLKDPIVYPLDDLATVKITKGGNRVTNNYVKDSIDHLEELYTKTGDSVKAVEMGELRVRSTESGLMKKEVNDIARTYNYEFKDKAFSKVTDEPLTSVNAQAYQNTRQGLKDVARRGLGDEAKELDSTISSLYNTKRLIDRNVESANRLRQKVDERGLGEKIGRTVLTALDIATLGTAKGAILKMFPRGLGYKTKNFIDLEESLTRNLKIIDREIKRIDSLPKPVKIAPVVEQPMDMSAITGDRPIQPVGRGNIPEITGEGYPYGGRYAPRQLSTEERMLMSESDAMTGEMNIPPRPLRQSALDKALNAPDEYLATEGGMVDAGLRISPEELEAFRAANMTEGVGVSRLDLPPRPFTSAAERLKANKADKGMTAREARKLFKKR